MFLAPRACLEEEKNKARRAKHPSCSPTHRGHAAGSILRRLPHAAEEGLVLVLLLVLLELGLFNSLGALCRGRIEAVCQPQRRRDAGNAQAHAREADGDALDLGLLSSADEGRVGPRTRGAEDRQETPTMDKGVQRCWPNPLSCCLSPAPWRGRRCAPRRREQQTGRRSWQSPCRPSSPLWVFHSRGTVQGLCGTGMSVVRPAPFQGSLWKQQRASRRAYRGRCPWPCQSPRQDSPSWQGGIPAHAAAWRGP